MDLGLGADAIKYRLRIGELHPLHRGVYAVGHTVLNAHGRWLAAVLACGPGAALSHTAAAALWDLRATASARIDVTVPSATTRRAPKGVRVHRTRRPIETTIQHGIPVTTSARTLADLADTATDRVLERAVEQAEILRLLDAHAIDALAATHPGRRGPARLRALLRTHEPAPLTRSELEDARAAFERDRARDAQLTAAGWRVLRFTDRQVRRDQTTLADRLNALLPAQ